MIRIFSDYEALSEAAANYIIETGRRTVKERGRFNLVLSGGKTPLRTYEILGKKAETQKALWQNTHFFWGDERCVPADHPESNYRSAKVSFLDSLDISPKQIHPIPPEITDLQKAAEDYEKDFPSRPDLILLGCGEDGHTASLFPGSPALNESEKRFVVVEAPVEPKSRITITPPAIALARSVLVLAADSNKAAALAQIFSKEGNIYETPARLLRDAMWFVDRNAAKEFVESGISSPPQVKIQERV